MNLFFFFISSLAGARKMKEKLKDYSFNGVRLNSYLVLNQNKETQWNVNPRLTSHHCVGFTINFSPHSVRPEKELLIQTRLKDLIKPKQLELTYVKS